MSRSRGLTQEHSGVRVVRVKLYEKMHFDSGFISAFAVTSNQSPDGRRRRLILA